MKRKEKLNPTISPELLKRRLRVSELLASCGMILIAVSLLIPLLNMLDFELLKLFCWVFAVGAAMFWAGRCVTMNLPGESLRMRRLRRMEFWAGACFAVAAFFWFWNQQKAPATAGPLFVLRDTILFSLAGAAIQLISAWMIYFTARKERKSETEKK